MRTLSVLFALVAVVCMIVAIAGMVTGRPGDRAGLLVRIAAVLCFGAAVGLNVAAHRLSTLARAATRRQLSGCHRLIAQRPGRSSTALPTITCQAGASPW
jgi:hypothetical protein